MSSILTLLSTFQIVYTYTMAKPMNHKRRLKALEETAPAKVRDRNALAMLLRYRGGGHGDAKKQQARRACRGRPKW